MSPDNNPLTIVRPDSTALPLTPCNEGRWVAVWTAMPQLTEDENMPPDPFVSWFKQDSILSTLEINQSTRMNRIWSSITVPFVKLYA
jgi:hypothetical protein